MLHDLGSPHKIAPSASAWIDLVAEADPQLEGAETTNTFASLQRASGDFLLTSPGWEDEELARLDEAPQEELERLMAELIERFLKKPADHQAAREGRWSHRE